MSEWKKVEINPTWDFTKEKELIGTYVGAETKVGPNESNLYTFRKGDGSLISVWGNTVLDTRFKNLAEGEELKVVYNGKVDNEKTGRSYHSFDVYHKEREIPVIDDDLSDNPL